MMAFTPPYPRWSDPRHVPTSTNESPHPLGSPSLRILREPRKLPPDASTGSERGSPFYPPSKPRYVSSPDGFIPIRSNEEREARAFTPIKHEKPSPATSLRTVTTIDTRESLPTLDSPLHGLSSTRPNFNTIYLAPRDISVRRALESSFDSAVIVTPQRKTPSPRELKKKASWGRDDDAVRKSRLKTELCMHYVNGSTCPFGENCTYAHGEEELQLTKLMDLHRAGLVDVETYRTKPCVTWISTGSCPFGKRCSGIHDPRVAGTHHSWLPHTETQGNTIATDINVEALHQKRLNELLYNNPFGDKFSMEADSYDDLYKLVCNTKPSFGKKRRATIAKHHKADIALQMRGPPGWKYKFRPQHIIFDELCMVIQKRAFRLTPEKAIEIPLSMCRRSAANTPFQYVVVREIAFGPDCDSTVRGVALWFDITESDVTVCTPQQAKRFRWKKPLRNRTNTPSPTMMKQKKKTSSSLSSAFESKDCFVMVRPYDTDAYNLVTEMLLHHLGVLRAQCVSQQMSDRSMALKALAVKDANIRAVFEQQMSHWETWAWPANEGREHVNDKTPVPPVDGKYSIQSSMSSDNEVSSTSSGFAVKRIWDSFASTKLAGRDQMEEDKPYSSKSRLDVFEALSRGLTLSMKSHSVLPHISASCIRLTSHKNPFDKHESERCWKALLLKPTHKFETNEWEAVRDHFENSRSTKVLSILQQ